MSRRVSVVDAAAASLGGDVFGGERICCGAMIALALLGSPGMRISAVNRRRDAGTRNFVLHDLQTTFLPANRAATLNSAPQVHVNRIRFLLEGVGVDSA